MKARGSALASIAAALGVLVGPIGASAESPEAFYRSAGLQIVVGYGPGGGYDVYARTVARHIGRHLPGSPNVVVQNMPGAGSLKAANYIYNVAPKDGSQIAIFARGLAMQPLLDAQGVQYDPTKFGWVGSVADEISVTFAASDRGFKSFDDLRKREMIVAASGSGADSAIYPYIMNAVLGTKFKVITGYPDSNASMLAIERGEVDGSAATSWGTLTSTKADWLATGKVAVLGQLALQKKADVGDVPLIIDFAKTPEDRSTLELIFARQSMAYPFTAPPGIPADRLSVLREAFMKTIKDEQFLAEAKKMGIEVQPASGEDVARIVQRIFASSPEVVARARAAIADGVKRTRGK
ncbi:MAG TPA: tripartite tricarboxylate transporter substrate-binding protein [Hyphomicrobiales bacterium]